MRDDQILSDVQAKIVGAASTSELRQKRLCSASGDQVSTAGLVWTEGHPARRVHRRNERHGARHDRLHGLRPLVNGCSSFARVTPALRACKKLFHNLHESLVPMWQPCGFIQLPMVGRCDGVCDRSSVWRSSILEAEAGPKLPASELRC